MQRNADAKRRRDETWERHRQMTRWYIAVAQCDTETTWLAREARKEARRHAGGGGSE